MTAFAEEAAPGVPYSACKSCGARIFFAQTEKGARIPINAAAHPEGNLVTVLRAGTVVAETYDPVRHGKTIRRTTHFADCAQAPAWRKARGA